MFNPAGHRQPAPPRRARSCDRRAARPASCSRSTSATVVSALTIFYSIIIVSLFVPILGGLWTRRAGAPEALASIGAGLFTLFTVRFFVTPLYRWVDPAMSGLVAAAVGLFVCLAVVRRPSVSWQTSSGSMRKSWRSLAPVPASAKRWRAERRSRVRARWSVSTSTSDGARRVAGEHRQAWSYSGHRAVDISDELAVQSALDGIATARGRLDAVVCTPAINVRKPILEYTGDEFDRVVPRQPSRQLQRAAGSGADHDGAEVRQHRALLVHPLARDRAGSVRLLDEQGGHRAAGENGARPNGRSDGVRVNAVGPGVVETPLTAPIKSNRDVVRRLCEEESDAALGAAVGDGRADAVSDLGRGELRDGDDHLRRWRMAGRRRSIHSAWDVTWAQIPGDYAEEIIRRLRRLRRCSSDLINAQLLVCGQALTTTQANLRNLRNLRITPLRNPA